MNQWLKNIVTYYQDNPEHYWFKRKLFGWGWVPVTWEGWLVTVGFLLLVWANAKRLEHLSATNEAVAFNLVPSTILLVVILLVICYKTGESPKWQFGLRAKTVMRLHASPYNRIKNGQKKIEVRLNDEKRRRLRIGDKIEFVLRDANPTQKINKKIVGLKTFKTFQDLFAEFPEEGSYGNMYQYYSPEEEQKYGVVAILLD